MLRVLGPDATLRGRHSNINRNPDCDRDSYTKSNSDSHNNTNRNPGCDAYRYTNSDPYGHGYSNSYSDCHCNRDSDAHRNPWK